MENFIIDLVILAAVFWLGWKLRGIWIVITLAARPQLMAEIARQARDIAQTPVEGEPRNIRVEMHANCLYLYAEDNDEFLAQGATLDQALAQVELRYPNKEFQGKISPEQVIALGKTVE